MHTECPLASEPLSKILRLAEILGGEGGNITASMVVQKITREAMWGLNSSLGISGGHGTMLLQLEGFVSYHRYNDAHESGDEDVYRGSKFYLVGFTCIIYFLVPLCFKYFLFSNILKYASDSDRKSPKFFTVSGKYTIGSEERGPITSSIAGGRFTNDGTNIYYFLSKPHHYFHDASPICPPGSNF